MLSLPVILEVLCERPTRLNVCILFLVLMFPIRICSAQQEDRCRDILQNGVKNEYSDLTNHDLRSSMRSALCAAYDESHNHKSGAEGGASIPVVGKLQGGYSDSQLDSLGGQYCGDNASNLSDSDHTNTMKRVASEKIVDEWGKCMDRQFAGQGGLQSSLRQ